MPLLIKILFNILEISPHFHNAKIFEFLSNQIVLDIYLKKLKNKNTESFSKETNWWIHIRSYS